MHLALFESDSPVSTSTVAFRAAGDAFLAWKAHLERRELPLRLTDHQLSYSMYFSDPDQNMHEIMTYERDHVAARLADNIDAR